MERSSTTTSTTTTLRSPSTAPEKKRPRPSTTKSNSKSKSNSRRSRLDEWAASSDDGNGGHYSSSDAEDRSFIDEEEGDAEAELGDGDDVHDVLEEAERRLREKRRREKGKKKGKKKKEKKKKEKIITIDSESESDESVPQRSSSKKKQKRQKIDWLSNSQPDSDDLDDFVVYSDEEEESSSSSSSPSSSPSHRPLSHFEISQKMAFNSDSDSDSDPLSFFGRIRSLPSSSAFTIWLHDLIYQTLSFLTEDPEHLPNPDIQYKTASKKIEQPMDTHRESTLGSSAWNNTVVGLIRSRPVLACYETGRDSSVCEICSRR
eukprot:CAMPEP_0182521236 /NCGR_PEP_ID=MMETSP1321-20130603/46022_1 /TAXON_ID=91990 /ORGANISM="Bolidomonas sp., Strain RCC1657" /LENGTH=317 /DNA_ID=CAMNT_0024729261 /DNA_START=14 /DNA_END=964 /DNA_ORIENTATION=-